MAAALLATVGLASFIGGAQELPSSKFVVVPDGTPVVPNFYNVVLDDEATGPRGPRSNVVPVTQALAAQYGARVTSVMRYALNGFTAEMSEKAAQALADDPRVLFVEPDVIGGVAATQNNPPAWGINRVDQRNLPLNTTYVFNRTGANVNAYIIDTGIRITHGDFGSPSRASVGRDTVGDGRNGIDCHGHGTHVAGTVGGTLHGVAKGVRLFAVRVLNCGGSGSASQAAQGVDWITGFGVQPAVANMSLNYPVSATLDTAIRNSIADGTTYVVAAGNANVSGPNTSPQRMTEVILVGATAINDTRASFSNFGPTLELFAPGQAIVSSWFTSNTATASLSGTSMASPHVAGAAALFLETNRTATPAAVRTAILNATTPGVVINAGTGSPNRMLHTITLP